VGSLSHGRREASTSRPSNLRIAAPIHARRNSADGQAEGLGERDDILDRVLCARHGPPEDTFLGDTDPRSKADARSEPRRWPRWAGNVSAPGRHPELALNCGYHPRRIAKPRLTYRDLRRRSRDPVPEGPEGPEGRDARVERTGVSTMRRHGESSLDFRYRARTHVSRVSGN
jgi:hypothetical protein